MDRFAGGHDEPLTPHELVAHDMVMRGHREELKVKLVTACVAVAMFWLAVILWGGMNLVQILVFTPSYLLMLFVLWRELRWAYINMYLDQGFVEGKSAERRGDQ